MSYSWQRLRKRHRHTETQYPGNVWQLAEAQRSDIPNYHFNLIVETKSGLSKPCEALILLYLRTQLCYQRTNTIPVKPWSRRSLVQCGFSCIQDPYSFCSPPFLLSLLSCPSPFKYIPSGLHSNFKWEREGGGEGMQSAQMHSSSCIYRSSLGLHCYIQWQESVTNNPHSLTLRLNK